ncbi:hypothetical protein S23_46520 [Bradyrhizobium cosmicum]|uniref:Uncharacterized protein n=1 Tax=Bradyrhizobium cosmicum TaxID=1404864 RepID=A0AAI8QDV4_9BRAD|nr:hypothetical protein S23_46520 [Bradyrhizobium cosmicum]
MTRSGPSGWIDTLPAQVLRRAMQLGLLVTGPERHVTRVIAHAANRARTHRARSTPGLSISRTEQ